MGIFLNPGLLSQHPVPDKEKGHVKFLNNGMFLEQICPAHLAQNKIAWSNTSRGPVSYYFNLEGVGRGFSPLLPVVFLDKRKNNFRLSHLGDLDRDLHPNRRKSGKKGVGEKKKSAGSPVYWRAYIP